MGMVQSPAATQPMSEPVDDHALPTRDAATARGWVRATHPNLEPKGVDPQQPRRLSSNQLIEAHEMRHR